MTEIHSDNDAQQAALEIKANALLVTVTDQATYGRAGEIAKGLRDMKKGITDWFAPMKKAAHESWKGICAKETETLKPLEEADAYVRLQMNTYLQEQERILRAEEARLRAEAEAAATKERLRLEKLAEKAIEKGNDTKADELLDRAEAVYVAPIAVQSVTAPVRTDTAHVGMVSETNVEVLDIKAFVNALVEQKSNMAMIEVKPSVLKSWVKSNGLETFPGLKIETNKVARVR